MSGIDRPEPAVLGERVRVARVNAGLTQEEAAAKLGMARTTLVAIEKGARRLRSDELFALADVYGVSHARLLRDGAVALEAAPQFRRNLDVATVADSAKAVELLSTLAVAHAELEAALGVDSRHTYAAPLRVHREGLSEQAEDAALALRTQLGLGLGPIQDVVGLAETELGVRVFVRRLPSAICGAYVYDDRVGACVLLNASHPRARQDWTLAHELGHLVADRRHVEATLLERSDDDIDEKFANLFAAAFLTPASVIRRRFRESMAADGRFSPRHLIYLASSFGVSPEAMCRRLERLNLLPAGTWDTLRDMGFSGDHVRDALGPDAAAPPQRRPLRLALLAAEALAREVVTEGEICDLLDLDRIAVREMVDALGGDIRLEPSNGR